MDCITQERALAKIAHKKERKVEQLGRRGGGNGKLRSGGGRERGRKRGKGRRARKDGGMGHKISRARAIEPQGDSKEGGLKG